MRGWHAERWASIRRAAATRRDLWALAALLLAGIALRAWLMASWRPAFLGYPDSIAYLGNSAGSFFADSLRPVGYPLFLAGARKLSSELSATILIQHALGVGSALLAYAGGRLLGLRPWPALLPAGILLLHGPTMWLEHSVLTESPFGFLVFAGLILAALAAGDGRSAAARVALAAGAGLTIAAAGSVRTVAIALLPVLAAWLLWAVPGRARQRFVAAAAAAVAGFGLLAANLLWAHSETGEYAFARADYYLPYARVAPFADCDRFTPPDGTERLCPTLPRSERPGPGYWVFSTESPIVRTYGVVNQDVQPAYADERTAAFYRRAVLAQPIDYLESVGRDLVRLVDPDFPLNPNRSIGNASAGATDDEYQLYLPAGNGWSKQNERGTTAVVAQLYTTEGIHRGELDGLRRYEESTRLTGVPMVVLLLLALAGPLLCAGRVRRSAALALAFAGVLSAAPVLTHQYDWRYAVAALGPVALAAAFGVQGAGDRLRRVRHGPPQAG
jgi:hypothetical protein